MRRTNLTLLVAFLFAILDGILASHFRFGSLSWSRDASTKSNVYKMVVEAHVAYRRASWVGNLNEGDTYRVWDRLYWGSKQESLRGDCDSWRCVLRHEICRSLVRL